MHRSLSLALSLIGVTALATPAAAAAQDGGWWAPVAERLTSPDIRQHPVCRELPDLPACRTERDDDRTATRDRGDMDRTPRAERRRDDDDRWESDDRWENDRSQRADRRGNGPPFCRSGAGHPVHGRAWCREKGWDADSGWRDASWGDVIFGRRGTRDDDRRLSGGGLLDVLGDVVFGRLERQGRELGGGALTGRFVEGRGRVLQVRAGDLPLAELLDADRDGTVDRVLLRDGR